MANTFRKALGEVLRDRRKQADLTLAEAVARLENTIAAKTLLAYETGKRMPSPERLVELALVYRTSAPGMLAAAMNVAGIRPTRLPGKR